MAAALIVAGYLAMASVAAAVLGRRLAAYAVTEWPNLYPGGVYRADGDDKLLVAFFAAFWPALLPLGLVLFRQPRRKKSARPGLVERTVFGGLS